MNHSHNFSLRSLLLALCVALLALSSHLFAQVVSVSPAQNALNIQPDTTIQVTFSEAMMTSSFNDTSSFLVYGQTSGRHRGTFVFTSGNTVATFTPTVPLKRGEVVTVDVTNKIKKAGGAVITPVVWDFTIVVNISSGIFLPIKDYTMESEPVSVYISDLDGDGDGDLAVAILWSNKVSIFKNNGDGTFATKVDYATDSEPCSIFFCDLDSDGDADLAVTNLTFHYRFHSEE